MKFMSIDFVQRSQLDGEGAPFPMESGAIAGQAALRNAKTGQVLVVRVPGVVFNDDGSKYQHEFTCYRGGAVVIPFDPVTKKVCLTVMVRPVVPPQLVPAYLDGWDMHIERPDPRFTDFGHQLFPMLGMETWQFPQGYSQAREAPEANARRILKSQAGFDAPSKLEEIKEEADSQPWSCVVIDPGNRVAPVPFYIAHVDPAQRLADAALPPIHWVDERGYFRACKQRRILSDIARCCYSLLKENDIW
jgi:hypothetical protein